MVDKIKLLSKIEKIQEKLADPEYPEDFQIVSSWKNYVENEILKEQIMGNEFVKKNIIEFKNKIQEIDEKLIVLDSKRLPDVDRDRLIDEKRLVIELVSIFETNEREIEQIEKEVNGNLEHLNLNS